VSIAGKSVDTNIPFAGPLSISLGGFVDYFNLNFRIAFDTYGLREFIQGKLSDPSKLADGLYVDAGKELLKLKAGIAAKAAFSGGLFEAGVHGDITANDIKISLHKGPTVKDDRVRLFKDVSGCLFETQGAVTASLTAFARVGVDTKLFGFVGYEKSIDIGSKVLLDLTSGCIDDPLEVKDPALATVATDGTGKLTLNLGTSRGSRNYKKAETQEEFTITHAEPAAGDSAGKGEETVYVTAFGITERYKGVKTIFADGGDGNTTITIAERVSSPARLVHSDIGQAQYTYLGNGDVYMEGAKPATPR
jgi:hypothetical protein